MKKGIFFLLLNTIVTMLTGQTALTISQAVEKGLRNSYDIRISRTHTAMANQRLKAAKKERLPTVNVFAQQGNIIINDRSPTTFINDFYRDRNLAVGIDGTWVVFDRFEGKRNKKQYSLTKEDRELKEKLAIENTVYTILLAYYDALIRKEALFVAEQSKELSNKRLKDAQVKENLGKISRYDLLRFENVLLLDATNVLQKERALETALVQLNTAMGIQRKEVYQLSTSLQYERRDYDLPSLYRTLEQQNKNLLSQNLVVEMTKLNTTATKNASLPSLSIHSGLSQSFNSTIFPETPRIKGNTFQFNLQFAANYNLFDGGIRKRATSDSKLQEQIALLEVDRLKINLYHQLDNAVESYTQQLEILSSIEELLRNLKLNLELEQDRYTNGLSSALDFRAVQLEYTNAQFAKLETIYQLIINELTILQLTGTLDKGN